MLVYAVKNGDWSDTTVWNTGSLPTNADVVRPNNFTVTIDVNVDVLEMRNDAGGGAVLGGSFTLNDGVTVTSANGFFGTYAGAAIGLLNYGGAGSVILNGDVEGSKSAVTNTCAISNTSTGTITINGNISSSGSGGTSQTLRNLSTGTFIINGDVVYFTGVILSNGSGTSTINGTFSSLSAGGNAITNTGVVTINGNVSHSHSVSQIITTKLLNSGTGIININGDISASFLSLATNGNSSGALISNDGSGIINIVGNVSQIDINGSLNTNNTRTIRNSSVGTINITGNILGAPHLAAGLASAVDNQSTGVVTVTGTLTPGTTRTSSGRSYCLTNTGSGIINFIGTANGDAFVNSLASISNESSGIVNITGNAIGGSTGLAVVNQSTGTINLNGNAIGGSSFIAIEGVNAAGLTIIEKAIYSNLGQSPIGGYIQFKTGTPEIEVLREDSVMVTLRDPLNVSGLLPAESDVRSGTTYNSGSSTGTLAMPAANLVQEGVPVGATFGTANLTPGDFWNYLISNGFATGSIGERLKESATTDIVGKLIQSF